MLSETNNKNKIFEFILGDLNNNDKIGNSYLQFDIEVKKDDGEFEDDNKKIILLVNNAFAFIYTEACNHPTGGTEV